MTGPSFIQHVMGGELRCCKDRIKREEKDYLCSPFLSMTLIEKRFNKPS